MPVQAVVLASLVTALAHKHMAPVPPTLVLAKHRQRLESLVTDAAGVDPLPLVLLYLVFPQLLTRLEPEVTKHAGQAVLVAPGCPVQQHQELPRKPSLGSCTGAEAGFAGNFLVLLDVLPCKFCDLGFKSCKELAEHKIKKHKGEGMPLVLALPMLSQHKSCTVYVQAP